jgi:serine/threonine protein kinase
MVLDLQQTIVFFFGGLVGICSPIVFLNSWNHAGVMFKPNPDIFEFEAGKTTATGQTFSLIMKYLSFGSLMHRLDAGLAKFRESPSICRCSYVDWKEPDKMFIGVDDWELKLYLALGIARGIRAMHAELVWHRDLKSSNVLINQYHPFHVDSPSLPLLTSFIQSISNL